MYYSVGIRGRGDPHDNYGWTVVQLLFVPYLVRALLSYQLSIFIEGITRSVVVSFHPFRCTFSLSFYQLFALFCLVWVIYSTLTYDLLLICGVVFF